MKSWNMHNIIMNTNNRSILRQKYINALAVVNGALFLQNNSVCLYYWASFCRGGISVAVFGQHTAPYLRVFVCFVICYKNTAICPFKAQTSPLLTKGGLLNAPAPSGARFDTRGKQNHVGLSDALNQLKHKLLICIRIFFIVNHVFL